MQQLPGIPRLQHLIYLSPGSEMEDPSSTKAEPNFVYIGGKNRSGVLAELEKSVLNRVGPGGTLQTWHNQN